MLGPASVILPAPRRGSTGPTPARLAAQQVSGEAGESESCVSKKILKDGDKGGKTVELGFTDDAVGIPEDHKLMGDEVYKGAMEAADKIKAGSIVPPANKDDLAKYEKSLA